MKTLLLVDDEVNVLDAYSLMLKHKGYRVLTARDGNEGLQTMLNEKVDLVISDINMPNISGLTFIKQIRRILKYRNLPVILLSAVGTKQNVFRGIELGIDAFLTKPCAKEMLYTTVDRLLYMYKNLSNESAKERLANRRNDNRKDTSILLCYKGASVTDDLFEFLSERFVNVYLEEDTSKIQERIYDNNIDLLIMEIGDSQDSRFKYLFHRYNENKFIEVPTIVFTERKRELNLFFNCFDFKVDKILAKPFEYEQLFKDIIHITSIPYLRIKLAGSIQALENKLLEIREKESAIITEYRNAISRIKQENYDILNNRRIQRSVKFSMVAEKNKKITLITKKISSTSKQFFSHRRSIVESISKVKTKLRLVNCM